PSVCLLGVILGAGLVFQAVYWLSAVGELQLVAQLLVRLLIHELAPALVGVVVIGRSGTAMAAELAGMGAESEVETLAAMGVDPLPYAVVPRVLSLVVSSLGLTIFMTVVALISGFLIANMTGVGHGNMVESLSFLLRNIETSVYVAVMLKCVLS